MKDFAELAAQADIVHYHFPWPYMDLVHFLARLNKPRWSATIPTSSSRSGY